MGHLYLVQLLEDGVAEGLARDAGQEGGLTGCAQPRTLWGRDAGGAGRPGRLCSCCRQSESQPLGAQLPSLQPGDSGVRLQGCWGPV